MFEIDTVVVDGRSFLALRAELPELPPLLLIRGGKGFVMCGYLNIEAAERVGAAAAVVSGVTSFEDVLNAEIRAATSKARALGLEPGKVVRDVLAGLA